jgi:quinol monooxygenase YgiN
MVVVIMEMRAIPEKCLELKQTLQALIEATRNEKGCLSHAIFEDIENKDHFCLVGQWQTQADWELYRQSERFSVLMGARSLLDREPGYIVNEVIFSHSLNNKL